MFKILNIYLLHNNNKTIQKMYTLKTIIKEKDINAMVSEFDFDSEDYANKKGYISLEMHFYNYNEISEYQKRIQEFADEEGIDVDFDEEEWEREDPYRDYGVSEEMFR